MEIPQILKVLKAERECIARQSGVKAPDGSVGICDRDCANCDLVLPDTEILEVYDFLINGYELLQNEGAESYTIKCTEPLSEEELARFKELCNQPIKATLQPYPDFELLSPPDGFIAVNPYNEKGEND